jgi:hypothetical protein
VNYGIVHDIVAVISSCQEARHNNVKEVNRMTHLLWGIESTLIQLLDMMVSSKGLIKCDFFYFPTYMAAINIILDLCFVFLNSECQKASV